MLHLRLIMTWTFISIGPIVIGGLLLVITVAAVAVVYAMAERRKDR